MNSNLELLAPVGSFEALKAAVQNGADAVYLGGKEFSARASANNFDREELQQAVEYSHIRGCKVFVTVNTIIKENEKIDFIKYIKFLHSIMVDALILQDIGMAALIKKLLPDFELHASTQMAAHSLNDVKYLESIGFKRVVLARELNINEIEYICKNKNTDVDIEVFVHGALCVCYSGQCLMSSVLGNRSGNRGRCAQPCRQKYKLYNKEDDVYINTDGDYLLSPRDLNSIENISKIIDSGVLSLKIEGRMKRPEYVATVVGVYKDAILNYTENNKKFISDENIDNLYTIFNRKFTKGYFLGEVGKDIMNSEKPNNRGLFIGNVISYNKKNKRLKIKLEKNLRKGDGLNIGGGTVGRIIKNNDILDCAKPGEVIEIDYIGNIEKGYPIYKTSDSRLIENVKKTFESNKENIKIPIKANFHLSLGSNPILSFEDFDGNFIRVKGDKIAELAQKVSLTDEKIKTQISKLGDTPYYLDEVFISLDKSLSMPISEINNLRRMAVESLNKSRNIIKDRNIRYKNIDSYISNKNLEVRNKPDKNIKKIAKINVSCCNIEQLNEVIKYDIDSIYYKDVETFLQAIDIASKSGKKISLYLPRIIRDNEKFIYEFITKNINKEALNEKIQYFDGFRVSNYGEIKNAKNNIENNIDISSWMNVINCESINFYKSQNIRKVCLSQEVSLYQIENMELNRYTDIEYMVYGSTEMMISEYCPMGVLTKDCKKDKRDANCRKSVYYLESNDNSRYRLSQDTNCRTTIYSDTVVNMSEHLVDLYKFGIDNFEVSFSFETEKEVSKVLSAFTNIVKIINDNIIQEINNDANTKVESEINTELKINKNGIDINYIKKICDRLKTSDSKYTTGHLFKEID